jgi:putative SOS response-associated peptidase YedK
MCGRYALRKPPEEIQQRFHLTNLVMEVGPRYNVAPSQAMPVIVQGAAGPEARAMRWGLIPSWAKDPDPARGQINARAEGIAEKPSFRTPFRRQRCLVPADGFYEWVAQGAAKQPYFVRFQDDRLFAFAGIYDTIRSPAGEAIGTYTIITTTPNALLAPLHHRMAVILSPDDEADWLDPALTDAGLLDHFLRPFPSDEMEAYPVAPLVNNPRNDAPDLVQRAGLF